MMGAPSKEELDRQAALDQHREKPCYGTNRCWNNVRVLCPVADECASIASDSKWMEGKN